MNEKKLTVGHVIKLFENTFSLKAICDSLGGNYYESTKKVFNRASAIETIFPTETENSRINDTIRIINDFMAWAIHNEYISTPLQNAVVDFIHVLFAAAEYEMPLNKNMMEHLLTYALSNSIYQIYSIFKKNFPEEDNFENLADALSRFDIFGTDEKYTEDMSAWNGCISLLLSLVKDKNSLFTYWEQKINSDDAAIDVKTNFNKWRTGKTKPSWSILKAFFNDKLCPPKEYFDEIDDEIGLSVENHWKAFKHILCFAYIITNLFDSLEKQKLITKETRYMIRNGARMYYREFYIIRDKNKREYSPNFEKPAKENLMFRTMFCFLESDLSKLSLREYLSGAYLNPGVPFLLDSSDGIF